MKTINLNSDMNYEGVMNARNMVLHVKDLTFIDLSGNRRTLSEVIGELSKSNGDSSSIDSSSNWGTLSEVNEKLSKSNSGH